MWQPVSVPPHRVYGTGMSVDPTGTIDDLVNVALGCGFPVESWCSEYDNAAYEVNIRYDDAIPAADEAFLFKLARPRDRASGTGSSRRSSGGRSATAAAADCT